LKPPFLTKFSFCFVRRQEGLIFQCRLTSSTTSKTSANSSIISNLLFLFRFWQATRLFADFFEKFFLEFFLAEMPNLKRRANPRHFFGDLVADQFLIKDFFHIYLQTIYFFRKNQICEQLAGIYL